MTIELSEYVIDAIADAVVKKMQEPCEDAISRDELLKTIDTWDKFGCDADTKLVPYQDHYVPYIHYDDVVKCIKGMPSVTPQPKTGHNCNKDYADCDQFVCSECGIELQDWHKVVRDDEYDDISYQEYAFRFCPSCGCEIKEVEK